MEKSGKAPTGGSSSHRRGKAPFLAIPGQPVAEVSALAPTGLEEYRFVQSPEHHP
jgi:hypothetical protein